MGGDPGSRAEPRLYKPSVADALKKRRRGSPPQGISVEGRQRGADEAQSGGWPATTSCEEDWSGFLDEWEEGASEQSEDHGGGRTTKTRRVLFPESVAFPMVFIFDGPVAADDGGQALGRSARIETGDEQAVTFGVRLAGSRGDQLPGDADDRTGEGQAEGFGFDGGDAHLVSRQSAVGLG